MRPPSASRCLTEGPLARCYCPHCLNVPPSNSRFSWHSDKWPGSGKPLKGEQQQSNFPTPSVDRRQEMAAVSAVVIVLFTLVTRHTSSAAARALICSGEEFSAPSLCHDAESKEATLFLVSILRLSFHNLSPGFMDAAVDLNVSLPQ